MVNDALLDVVMLVEVALLVLAAGVYFSHGLWLFVTQKRTLREMTAARGSLARLLTHGAVNVEEIEALRRTRRGVQVAAFLEISASTEREMTAPLRCARCLAARSRPETLRESTLDGVFAVRSARGMECRSDREKGHRPAPAVRAQAPSGQRLTPRLRHTAISRCW